MNETFNTYTFIEILNKWNIIIPVIQRDYAQGRIDEKTNKIRDNFIESVKYNLNNNNSMTLDFVYGKTEGLDFIPLDGQQRLTTLFLLHWYSIQKHSFGNEDERNNVVSLLGKFSYKTRESASRFCLFLANLKEIIQTDRKISEQIESNKNFSTIWKNDPTVSGMLVMLDEIQEKFLDFKEDLYELLANKRLITFQFLDMNCKSFKQSDSLYIKMNARGRPLTDFEIYKANFEDKLDKIDPTLRSEFSRKIDGSWQNKIFWKKYGEKSDDAFLNFFELIELYERVLSNDTNEQTQDDFYKINAWNKSSALLLMNCLNFFETHTNTESFFKTIFSLDNYETDKVCLFQKDIDLFDLCINPEKRADVKNSIMFFAVLNMIQNNSIDTYKLRIIRNLAWNSENELRFNNWHELFTEVKLICSDVNNLTKVKKFNTNQINEEKEKFAFISNNKQLKETLFELEDLAIFKGHLTALSYNDKNLKELHDTIISYFSNNPNSNQNAILFGRAMLSYGNYAEYYSGTKWKYVNSEQSLAAILHDASKDTKDGINKTFTRLTMDLGKSTIESIINNAVKNFHKDNYIYYYIKYPEMLRKSKKGLMQCEENFKMACLTGETLRGWWYDPYLYTVYKRLPAEIQETLGTKFLKNLGYLDDCKPLTINNCEILPVGSGWRITRKSNTVEYQKQFEILNKKLKDGVLIVPKDVDRIECCCSLIKEIYNWKE